MNIAPWYYYEELDVHDKDDDTFYKIALERVWILGTAWGYSKYSDFANGDDLNINATITCLRAKELSEEEKQNNGGGDEDAGATLSGRGLFTLVPLMAFWGAAGF